MIHQVLSWDDYFMNLLDPIAARSKDPNTQIGCVIASSSNNILSTGYNSFPRGIEDNIPERYERPEKYLWIEHADRNAIYSAARSGTALEGSKMYLSGIPCMDCARGIIQVGIGVVIYDAIKQKAWEERGTQYNEVFEKTKILLKEAGVYLKPWMKKEN